MSKNINDSTKLKLAKYILKTLREIEDEAEKSTTSGMEIPKPEISIDTLIKNSGLTIKGSEMPSSEVIRGMFLKKGDRLIPKLGTSSLAEFSDELEEQIKMYEGAFGREVLRSPQSRFVESGFVHNAARRK